jgi:hypothetical protein
MSFLKNLLKISFLLLLASPVMADDGVVPADDVVERSSELPDSISLRGFAHAGSGCAAGSAQGEFPIGSELFITWDGFEAEAGQGIPLRDARKNCLVNLDINHTTGWQYTVESIEYSGKVEVVNGTQAVAGSAYYFQGSPETVRSNTLFEGPLRRNFRVRDTTDESEQVWSTCDATRSLNINFQVRISDAASSAATGTVSFGNGRTAATLIKLKWRQCL